MMTVFEKVTDDRGVRPAPLRLGTDDSICLPPSPKPFFPRGEQFEFKGHTHTHVSGSVGNLGSGQWWRRNGRSDRSASLQHYFTDKITTAFYFPAIASNTLKSEKCSAAILFFSLPTLCLTWRGLNTATNLNVDRNTIKIWKILQQNNYPFVFRFN